MIEEVKWAATDRYAILKVFLGFKVLRFSNEEILNQIDKVINSIKSILNATTK